MQEEKRMARLRALKEIAEQLNEAADMEHMLQGVLQKLLSVMDLETGWIFFIDGNEMHRLAADVSLPPALRVHEKRPMCEGSCWCVNRYRDGKLQKATNIIECQRIEGVIEEGLGDTRGITHHATIPLRAGTERFGLLNVAAPHKTKFTEEELALLEAIAYQIGTTIQRVKLVEQERQYVVTAERNRLARDLHDSVKQLLFSIMLTARGGKDRTADPDLQDMLSYIGDLSQEALQEMRTLIWQLRPEGLEHGLVEALRRHGSRIGLQAHPKVSGLLSLSDPVEEALWRIGQEALHNCQKHAGCQDVYIHISGDRDAVTMEIVDRGAGFRMEHVQPASFGLRSMKERARLAGGTVKVTSEPGAGTVVTVILPLQGDKHGH